MREWQIVPLTASIERGSFSCGETSLDDFFIKLAGQYQRKGFCRVYVALEKTSNFMGGYYTLSAGSVRIEDVPKEVMQKLPKHPIPVAHLGRLAVDSRIHGQKLGSLLLLDAFQRIVSVADSKDSGLGVYAVEVVALNEKARSFYEHFGFSELVDNKNHMYISLTTLRKLFLNVESKSP